MRKELTCFITTNEEGEEAIVQRVADSPEFIMLRLGQNRMVLNLGELLDSIGAIGHYSKLFQEEELFKSKAASLAASRAKAPKVEEVIPTLKPVGVPKKSSKVAKEDEGAVVLQAELRSGPTDSELQLARMTGHMNGGEVVLREEKK